MSEFRTQLQASRVTYLCAALRVLVKLQRAVLNSLIALLSKQWAQQHVTYHLYKYLVSLEAWIWRTCCGGTLRALAEHGGIVCGALPTHDQAVISPNVPHYGSLRF